MAQSIPQVCKAIHALYHGESPQQMQAANKWLVEFQKRPEAWNVASQLLNATGPQAGEQQYFGANMFAIKVGEEWDKLDQPSRAKLRALVMNVFKKRALDASASVPPTTRLAVTVCEMAISERNGVKNLLHELLPLASSNMNIVMHVLRVLPERIDRDNLSLLVRESGKTDLRMERRRIFQLLRDFMLREVKKGRGQNALLQQALECLHAFIPLGVTVTQLQTEGILDACVAILRLDAVQYLEKVSEVVAGALEINLYPRETGRDASAAKVLQLLVGLRPIYAQAAQRGKQTEHLCAAICNMSSIFGEAEMDMLMLGSPQALQLVDLQLQCSRHPNQNIVLQSLEFWHVLQDRPVLKRHPQLRETVFVHLLNTLVGQMAYPKNFSSWERNTGDQDRDGFNRFRDIIWETLQIIQSLLKAKFLSLMLAGLKATDISWQRKESLLFATRSVAGDVKDLLQGGQGHIKQAIGGLLRSILSIAISGLHSSNPYTTKTTCDLIGAYAPWVSSQPSLIQPLVMYLMKSARVTPAAGRAFMELCKQCKSILAKNVQSLSSVLSTVYCRGQLEGVALEGKKKFVSGLAELVSNLNAVQDRQRCLQLLTQPIMNSIKQALHRPGGSSSSSSSSSSNALGSRDVLAQQLELLAMCVSSQQFVQCVDQEKPQGTENLQTVLPLLKGNWALIEGAAQRWPRDEKIVVSICKLFEACFESLDSLAEPLLGKICTISMQMFSGTHLSCCLEVLTFTLQVFGSHPAAASQFKPLLGNIYKSLASTNNGSSLRDPAVLGGFFSLCENVFLRCRSAILPLLNALLLLGARSLSLNENRLCRTILVVLLTIMNEDSLGPTEQQAVNSALASVGPRLVQALLIALATQLPSMLSKKVGALIYCMLQISAEVTRGWVHRVLADPSFPSQHLKPQDKEVFLKALWALRPQGKADTSRRFCAMVADFSAVCRSNNTSECLLAYLLDPKKPSSPGTRRNAISFD